MGFFSGRRKAVHSQGSVFLQQLRRGDLHTSEICLIACLCSSTAPSLTHSRLGSTWMTILLKFRLTPRFRTVHCNELLSEDRRRRRRITVTISHIKKVMMHNVPPQEHFNVHSFLTNCLNSNRPPSNPSQTDSFAITVDDQLYRKLHVFGVVRAAASCKLFMCRLKGARDTC